MLTPVASSDNDKALATTADVFTLVSFIVYAPDQSAPGDYHATRQAAGGASYGGHMANWLAVTTTRYKALVSHAGLFDQSQQWGTSDIVFSRERSAGGPPWENAAVWTMQNPLSRAGNLKTPMLVTVGERDYRVPMNNAIQLWSALQRMRVPGRLIVFPDENHWVLRGENSRFFYSEIHSWLAKWFGE